MQRIISLRSIWSGEILSPEKEQLSIFFVRRCSLQQDVATPTASNYFALIKENVPASNSSTRERIESYNCYPLDSNQ
ncbi:MAG: hypothetical protein ACOCG6_07245 [Candidatus Cloacimonadaceae bacterium]